MGRDPAGESHPTEGPGCWGTLLGLGSRGAVGCPRAFLSELAQVVVGAFALEGRGALVGAADLVPEGEILPIVVVKVQVVVGVVG